MKKSKVFLWLSLGFIGGVSLVSFYYPQRVDAADFMGVLAGALIVLAVFYKNSKIALAGLTILFFVLGAFLTSLRIEKIVSFNEDKLKFSAVVQVMGDPEYSGQFQKIIARKVTDDFPFDHSVSKKEKILLNAGVYPVYAYGDELRVSCILELPKNNFGSAKGNDSSFDYRMYLAKDGVYYICNHPLIEKIDQDKGNVVYGTILKIKSRFQENIDKLIPAPESGLLTGLIMGGGSGLSKETQDSFSRTGMTHIVAVSGYNVAIVAEYLMFVGIFLGLWRKQAFWFAVLGIILFVIMTGFYSSAVRAGIMGILLIWAMRNGRLANAQNAILFSAAIMLMFNPLLLRWDIGFQMSFLATLGIVYFYPISEKYFSGWIETKHRFVLAIMEILLLTLSAQIFVLPIIIFNFNRLSLISPLANLLILPIIPVTMLVGFLTALASFILPPLAIVFSWLVYLLLKYETFVINFLAGLKYASVEIKLTWMGVAVWYIMVLEIIYRLKHKNYDRTDNNRQTRGDQ